MSKRLQITLYVITAWLAIIGTLFLFFPSVAEKVMAAALPDKGLNMLYGQVALTFAYLAFLAARGGEGTYKLTRLVMALTLGHVLVFAYQLIAGVSGFASAGVPLILNAVFTILVFFFRKDVK